MTSTNPRLATAAKKRTLALRLLRKGKTNADIQEAVIDRFDSGIGPDTLAKLRVQIKAEKRKPQTKPKPVTDLVLLQDNGTSGRFKAALQAVLDQMPAEGIQAFAMNSDGTVRVQQVHEFLLTPPRGQVLGLLGGSK